MTLAKHFNGCEVFLFLEERKVSLEWKDGEVQGRGWTLLLPCVGRSWEEVPAAPPSPEGAAAAAVRGQAEKPLTEKQGSRAAI